MHFKENFLFILFIVLILPPPPPPRCFYLLRVLWALQVQGQRVCSAHSTHARRGPDVRRGKKLPTKQQKKAAVFKPPLRFPAPGASPLHKIKQPGVCFISPPAAQHPRGHSSRRAQPDTAAPRLHASSLARGDSAQ